VGGGGGINYNIISNSIKQYHFNRDYILEKTQNKHFDLQLEKWMENLIEGTHFKLHLRNILQLYKLNN
jgi:hypothetical protein